MRNSVSVTPNEGHIQFQYRPMPFSDSFGGLKRTPGRISRPLYTGKKSLQSTKPILTRETAEVRASECERAGIRSVSWGWDTYQHNRPRMASMTMAVMMLFPDTVVLVHAIEPSQLASEQLVILGFR